MRWDEFDEIHWEGHTDPLDTGGLMRVLSVGSVVPTYLKMGRRQWTA